VVTANAVTAFLDDHVAAGAGDRPAVHGPGGSITYRGLLELAGRVGNALRAAGIDAEQRVAILLPDGVPWVATFFGVVRLGAVAVPLNTRLPAADWLALLRDSRARALVADAALLAGLGPGLAGLPHLRVVLAVDDATTPGPFHAAVAAASPELAPEPLTADDVAFWLYTSGTTGTPKAAVHLHRDLLACRHYGLEVLGVTAGDRTFATSRLFFAYALGNALLIPLFTGAETYLAPAWPEPGAVAAVVAAFRPTLFFSVPTFYARLLAAGVPAETFRAVRCAISAGERLPAALAERWRARFGVEILDGLGATETIYMVLSNRPGRSRPGSAGTPVPGTDARLLDASGQEVAPGQPGELYVRTPSASPRYWNRVDQSRRTFPGEWFRTGDVMTRDAEGFYYHCGREDDLFKVAGQWVAPADVEAVLLSHPDVADAGVVGAAEGGGLVKAFAFVVARQGTERAGSLIQALERLAAAKLPAHQRPRAVRVVPELPRTATGKLQRFRLRAQVETGAPVEG
jgi:benzoate-CoA ligase family protein